MYQEDVSADLPIYVHPATVGSSIKFTVWRSADILNVNARHAVPSGPEDKFMIVDSRLVCTFYYLLQPVTVLSVIIRENTFLFFPPSRVWIIVEL